MKPEKPRANPDWWTKSAESLLPSKKFSPETARALTTNGAIIITASGESISMQRAFRGTLITHVDKYTMASESSAGQFAVFPNGSFVTNSFNRPFEEIDAQRIKEEDDLKEKLQRKDLKLIIPEAGLVTELFLKLKFGPLNPPRTLFGRNIYTFTSTTDGRDKNGQEMMVRVGGYQKEHGLFVARVKKGESYTNTGLLIVVAPKV